MIKPKYKIGDEVYSAYTTINYNKCTKCHQEMYNDGNSIVIVESYVATIIGISIKEGFCDSENGISYLLDTKGWPVREDSLFLTAQEAEDAQRE